MQVKRITFKNVRCVAICKSTVNRVQIGKSFTSVISYDTCDSVNAVSASSNSNSRMSPPLIRCKGSNFLVIGTQTESAKLAYGTSRHQVSSR